MEWSRELVEVDPLHRHVSHLYGLHPGRQFTAESDPARFAAYSGLPVLPIVVEQVDEAIRNESYPETGRQTQVPGVENPPLWKRFYGTDREFRDWCPNGPCEGGPKMESGFLANQQIAYLYARTSREFAYMKELFLSSMLRWVSAAAPGSIPAEVYAAAAEDDAADGRRGSESSRVFSTATTPNVIAAGSRRRPPRRRRP